MRTVRDVTAYLSAMNRRYEEVEGQPGTFLIHASEAFPPIALRVDPPLVVLRVHIGDAPKQPGACEPLFRKLLQLNTRSLVHTSFGLEDDRIVLTSALELENLDINEIEATLDELDMTLAQQVPQLAELSGRGPSSSGPSNRAAAASSASKGGA